MTTKTNPLAVMDADRYPLGTRQRAEMIKAQAAVAELVEAAKAATEEKMHDGASSREACDRLVAALAPFAQEGE